MTLVLTSAGIKNDSVRATLVEGVLELTALPSLAPERWRGVGGCGGRAASERRRRPLPGPLDAGGGPGGYLGGLARQAVGRPQRRRHGDEPPHRRRLHRLDAAGWRRPGPGRRRLRHLPAPRPPGPAENTMADAERWAATIGVPAHAICDDTAIKVVGGAVEVVSEGHRKAFGVHCHRNAASGPARALQVVAWKRREAGRSRRPPASYIETVPSWRPKRRRQTSALLPQSPTTYCWPMTLETSSNSRSKYSTFSMRFFDEMPCCPITT